MNIQYLHGNPARRASFSTSPYVQSTDRKTHADSDGDTLVYLSGSTRIPLEYMTASYNETRGWISHKLVL